MRDGLLVFPFFHTSEDSFLTWIIILHWLIDFDLKLPLPYSVGMGVVGRAGCLEAGEGSI